jgi:hypothetical protein
VSDPILATVLVKTLLSIGVLLVAWRHLSFGWQMYRDGLGSDPGDVHFKWGDVELRARGSGAVVMSTALIWGLVLVYVAPNIESSDGDWRVTSFALADLTIDASTFRLPSSVAGDPDIAPLEFYARSFLDANEWMATQAPSTYGVTLNGTEAVLNPSTVRVYADYANRLRVTGLYVSDSGAAEVTFYPEFTESFVLFQPVGAASIDSEIDDSAPNPELQPPGDAGG